MKPYKLPTCIFSSFKSVRSVVSFTAYFSISPVAAIPESTGPSKKKNKDYEAKGTQQIPRMNGHCIKLLELS